MQLLASSCEHGHQASATHAMKDRHWLHALSYVIRYVKTAAVVTVVSHRLTIRASCLLACTANCAGNM